MRLARCHLCGEAVTLSDALKVNGKARRKTWINSQYHIIVNHERKAFQAKDSGNPYWIDMSFDNMMADDWEPYKEPCKHEPWDLNIDKMIDGDFVMLTYTKRDGVMTTICKCGSKIRAKEWVEV